MHINMNKIDAILIYILLFVFCFSFALGLTVADGLLYAFNLNSSTDWDSNWFAYMQHIVGLCYCLYGVFKQFIEEEKEDKQNGTQN